MSSESPVDVVVLTALTEERDAFLKYVETSEQVDNKGRMFHRARVGQYQVVILCMHGMGNVRAAAATQQAIGVWNPTHILLTGIAGGIKKMDTRLLGDVLVAEQVVDYESGKQAPTGIQHRYQVYRPAQRLLDAAMKLPQADWALAIKALRPDGTTGRIIPKVHYGVIGSGQKVVTDPSMVNELQSDWAELIGIEMEGIGTALATYESEQSPGFIMIKGISDWADPNKEDGWRACAAESSAAFAVALLKSNPIEKRNRVQAQKKDTHVHYSRDVKRTFVTRLSDWEDLADYFDIPRYIRARFEKGEEPRRIWDWLEERKKLGELVAALQFINREDLAKELETSSSPQ